MVLPIHHSNLRRYTVLQSMRSEQPLNKEMAKKILCLDCNILGHIETRTWQSNRSDILSPYEPLIVVCSPFLPRSSFICNGICIVLRQLSNATEDELKQSSSSDEDGFDSCAIVASSQTASTKIFFNQPNIDHPTSVSEDLTSHGEAEEDESDSDDDDRTVQPEGTAMDVTETELTRDDVNCLLKRFFRLTNPIAFNDEGHQSCYLCASFTCRYFQSWKPSMYNGRLGPRKNDRWDPASR
jgi:hypothetical protein